MNPAPDSMLWVELLMVTGGGTALVVGSAALLERVVRTAGGRRLLWQAATVCLGALVLGELTGSAPLFARLLRVSTAPPAESGLESSPEGDLAIAARGSPDARERATGAPVSIPMEGSRPRAVAAPADPARASEEPAASLAPPGADASRSLSPAIEWTAPASSNRDERLGAALPPHADRPDPLRTDDAGGGVWWPGAIWLAGAAPLLARALFAWAALFLLSRRRPGAASADLEARAVALARLLGLGHPIRLLEARGIAGPMALGILRRAIVLPGDFERDHDPAQQDAMLLHELAHLRGHDPAWHMVSDLVTIALWWHPLAWWARHELRAAAEFAADEASLAVAGGPEALAASLVKVGARLVRPGFTGLARVEGSGFRSGLGRRVEKLLRLSEEEGEASAPPDRFWKVTISAVLIAAFLCSSLWLRPVNVEPDAASYAQNVEEGESTMTTTLFPLWKRSLAGFTVLAVLGAGAPQTPDEDPGDRLQEPADIPVVDLSENPPQELPSDPPALDGSERLKQNANEDLPPDTEKKRRQETLEEAFRRAMRQQNLEEALGLAIREAAEKENVRRLEDQIEKLSEQLKGLSRQLEVEREAAKELQARAAEARAWQQLDLASAQSRQPGLQADGMAFALSSRTADGSSQSDLIGLATKLADAMGDARLARLRYSRVKSVADQNLISQDELDVARISLETAEQKIQLLREIARAYLSRAESQLVFLHGERERLRAAKGGESSLPSVESQMRAAESVYSVLKSLASLKEPGAEKPPATKAATKSNATQRQ